MYMNEPIRRDVLVKWVSFIVLIDAALFCVTSDMVEELMPEYRPMLPPQFAIPLQ
jgi:hypothetical protein